MTKDSVRQRLTDSHKQGYSLSLYTLSNMCRTFVCGLSVGTIWCLHWGTFLKKRAPRPMLTKPAYLLLSAAKSEKNQLSRHGILISDS